MMNVQGRIEMLLLALLLWLLAVLTALPAASVAHEDVPYENVTNICKTCVCLTGQDADKRDHYMLSCVMKNFKHILPRWPEEFGTNHNGIDIAATFSGNKIELLQQLPATNASLSFTCRYCNIKQLQVPLFMDTPNIRRLDLSRNALTVSELTPDVFRGPYRVNSYEPIALMELDLSSNHLNSLDRKLFEHTPNLTKINLSHNKFEIIDKPTAAALSSLLKLQKLDLSHTDIKVLPHELFQRLSHLRVLNLAGNQLTVVPSALSAVSDTLEILNLAGNRLATLTEDSFGILIALKRLNISGMPSLKSVDSKTLQKLIHLEYVECAYNPKLETFDLDNLKYAVNLTYLDISYCSISSLVVGQRLVPPKKSENKTLASPWPRLHQFEIAGNPWACDCDLLLILEYMGGQYREVDSQARCEAPYFFSGALISNMTADEICSLQIPKKYRVIDEDPPRFLRKRYIILTVITAAVVILVGLMIGFLVSCIRRRLKENDYGLEPIRYTSVRCSTLSAFQPVGSDSRRGQRT